MRKCIFGLIASLAISKAATERYIIQYDDAAWNSLHINSLADETVYVLNHLQMTVADLTADEVAMYSSIPGITLTQDEEVEMYGGVQENPNNWGIDRIDQRALPLDKKFHYGNEGEGVNVYIVDTGVQPKHVEFEGRATLAKNFAKDGKDYDCQGHGTHVASSVAGKTVGVAKKAKVLGVKVLNCQGRGQLTNVIAGINWVVGEHKKDPNQKSVINMSLGGPKNKPTNAAADAANKAGVVVVVAAGNSKKDACTFSPAGATGAITVAASDDKDSAADFTNFGKCVDIYAPGVTINGAWIPGDNDYKLARGTSMASPHVAGVAALILASGKAKTPDEVRAFLHSSGTKDVIQNNKAETPNRLVYADPAWTK